MKERKCIIILGMHRSGTSAMGGLLHVLGVNMGINLLPPAEDNPKGFFENEKITLFNDSKLLPYLKSSYDDVIPFHREWSENAGLEPYYLEAEKVLASEYSGSALFGIKDPRMCILFPFWERVFKKLELELYTILPVRNPLEVAHSLARRNGFSIEKSFLLWSRHVLLGEFYSRSTMRVFTTYGDLLDKTEETIARLQEALGLRFPITYEDAREELGDFLDRKMRHHRMDLRTIDGRLPEFIRRTATELFTMGREFSDGKDKWGILDGLREDLNNYSRLFYNNDFLEEKELLASELAQKRYLLAEAGRLNEKLAQLYVDSGDGLFEKDSLSVSSPEGEKVLEFDLSAFPFVKDIRFDPLNDCGIIEIQNIELDANGKTEKLTVRSFNAVTRENNTYFFQTADPQFFLTGNFPFTRSGRLRIYIKYRAVGKDALGEISKAVLDLIASKDSDFLEEKGLLASELAQMKYLLAEAGRLNEKLAQLYVDSGDGFFEKGRLSVSCPEQEEVLEFDLSAFPLIKDIRFDPLNDCGIIEIQNIEMDANGKTEKLTVRSSNAVTRENNTYFFQIPDPQFFLTGNFPFTRSGRLRIYIKYRAIGKNALSEISKALLNLIASKDHELDRLGAQVSRTTEAPARYESSPSKSLLPEDDRPSRNVLKSRSWKLDRALRRIRKLSAGVAVGIRIRIASMRPRAVTSLWSAYRHLKKAPLFDSAFYLENNPDVREAGINPLHHYLVHGFREGRNPNPLFYSACRLDGNTGVRDACVKPPSHHLNNGGAEDRLRRLSLKFLEEDPGNENLVIVVSHDATNSGAPLIALNIGKTLRSSFRRRVITVLLNGGPLEEEFGSIGAVYNLGKYSLSELGSAVEVEHLFASLRKSGARYCICNTVLAGALVPLLDKYGFSYVNLIHELPTTIKLLGATEAAFEIARYSKSIVFPARFVRDAFASEFPIAVSRTTIKPQGANFKNSFLSDRDAARLCFRERLGVGRDAFVVLGCGYAELRKGVDVFGRVAATVLAKNGSKVIHFVWLGNRALDLEQWIRHDADVSGIRGHLHFVDFERDPGQIFAAADLFILTSREDPFPTVVLEAMDAALPVVAFEGAGGAPEILADGCGVVVPYLDVESMAREVISLVADHDRYDSISKKAKKKIGNEIDYDHYVGKLLELAEAPTCNLEPYRVNFDGSRAGKSRVLHVIANFNVGGSTQLVVDLVERLTADYYHKIITCSIPSSQAYIGPDIEVFCIDKLSAARKAIIEFDPCFAHIHYWGRGDHDWYRAMFEMLEELEIPVIQNVNVPIEPFENPSIVKNVYVSDYVKENFPSPTDAQVIYPGSDFGFFSARDLASYPDNCIGMVYRLDWDKVTPESIDVFIEVAKRMDKMKCLIVGDGELFPVYAEKVWQSGLTANFEFSGYISYYDLPRYYREMSIFVAPVRSESFGQVVPFAMSIGMPVVGYDVGALPEIIGTKDLLAPTGNVSRLADIIVDLLRDREKMARIAIHNQQRVRQLFSVEKMISDYARLYGEACGGSGPRSGRAASSREVQSSLPKRYKMLITLPDLEFGGGQIFAIRLANFLATMHEVYLYNARPHLWDERVISLIDSKVKLLHSSGLPYELRRYIVDLQIEVVNSHVWWADKLVFQAAAALPVQWAISMHGCYEAFIKHPEWDAAFFRIVPSLLARADKVLYIADKNLTILEHVGLPKLKAKFTKVYNGYCRKEDVAPQSREAMGINDDDFVFGIVSRGIPEKGWQEAIHATMMVNRSLRNGRRAHLILVGDSEYSQSLKAQFDGLAYIHFTGISSEPAEWIQMFDVGMLPSYFISESQPLAILEYLAYQKPVIATDVGQVREMLSVNGKSAGILIPLDAAGSPVDPKRLSHIMRSLLANDNGILDSLRSNTLEVFQKHDMEVCGNRYFNEMVA